ncbi:FKBP-type peptidyl-prolyl cis-trans isomerase [Labilibaculum sp.]|uniref:FKBP-type peptidyl-prolyl cis-trans isomerase n=1 Tax=Labilibaculum sp. TaxID=2060723 RepID=UPI0035689100
MKQNRIILVLLALVLSFSACRKVDRSGKMEFQSSTDSISYALGYIEATNFVKMMEKTPFQFDSIEQVQMAKAIAKTQLAKKYKDFRTSQFDSINSEAFYKGFINELAYGKSYFTNTKADFYLRKMFKQKKEEKEAIRKELGEKNLAKGEKFLENNRTKEGIHVTESGLQYEILTEGTGKIAEKSDRVKCVYHGTLIDGTVFDSSLERGDTTSFRVNRVVKGWTEALQIMPEGSKWRLYLPAELGYGEKGNGEKIGPNEALIFDLNLVEVVENKRKK